MDTATLHELRALRARAYGPSADIHHDPAALERLRELERLDGDRDAALAEPVDAEPVVAEPVRAEPIAAEPVVAEPVALPPVAPRQDQPARRVARRSTSRGRARGLGVLWGLSVLAAAAAGSAVTYALVAFAPVQTSHGAEQIATLDPSAAVDLPAGWMGAGPSSTAYDYLGLTIFETSSGSFGTAGRDCITAAPTADIPAEGSDTTTWSVSGPVYTGCRIGVFPATIQVEVGSNVPEEMRAAFPDGSALQFVRDGDRIGVFLDDGSATRSDASDRDGAEQAR